MKFDGLALVMMVLAALALMRYKVGVIPLIGACALAGLGLKWLGWV